jgi:glycine dehydrogenase subunit 1
MSYVPHVESERAEMLARIGVSTLEDLFHDIPAEQRFPALELPEPVSELEIMAELQALSEANLDCLHAACFLGAGAYHHFVPSVVGHLIGRAEFYTAYTPYQPEISQGTLQAIFEYQTMICALTGMEVSNASHYDGATSMAEAVIAAVSASRGRRTRVVMAPTIHPEYRATARTYAGVRADGPVVADAPITFVGDDDLSATLEELAALVDEQTACLIVQNPDFFGRIQDLAGLAETVHGRGALLVVVCDPIALGLLKPPGAYGADIAVGEGQPLGIPLSFGGPYLGFFACTGDLVRRMAGRLVGETVDVEGERGYVLTLSTREQHIRRERATSNICTNQGLNALAAAIYLAAMGKCGLPQIARLCYHKAHYAAQQIAALPGYEVDLATPFFREFVVRCPQPVAEINSELLDVHDIIGGYDLGQVSPDLDHHMLLCVTEMNTVSQIEALVSGLEAMAHGPHTGTEEVAS